MKIEGVWPEIDLFLNKKYNILDYHDLLYDNQDIILSRLYGIFYQYKDKIFKNNEKVIIILRDTDYYTSDKSIGFTLFNIYKIFRYLNLPPEFFTFLTFQQREEENLLAATELQTAKLNLVYLPYMIWFPHPSAISQCDINLSQIRYSFVCLNGVFRASRKYNLSNLIEKNLANFGMISVNPHYSTNTLKQNQSNYKNIECQIPEGLHLRSTEPSTRINDDLILNQEQLQKLIKCNYSILNLPTHQDIVGGPNSDNKTCQPKFLQYAFWNLVVETVADYHCAHISEKTITAILTKRPFIVLGAKGTLQLIKNLGFKTFDKWIDESYDDQKTFACRSDYATDQLSRFCHLSKSELIEIAKDMEDVLQYNFNHYINTFGKKNLLHYENIL